MNNWIDIIALDEIPKLGSRVIRTDTMDVAVFRTRDDQVFACATLPAQGRTLVTGYRPHGTSVTCPLHNWKIDLASGEARARTRGCTNVFATKVEGGRVLLALKADVAAARPVSSPGTEPRESPKCYSDAPTRIRSRSPTRAWSSGSTPPAVIVPPAARSKSESTAWARRWPRVAWRMPMSTAASCVSRASSSTSCSPARVAARSPAS